MRALLLIALLSVGCSRSHVRDADADAAALADAASRGDGSRDGSLAPDAGAVSCEPQQARAVQLTTDRPAYLARYRWNGVSCGYAHYDTMRSTSTGLPIDPALGCEGDACDALFTTEVECVARYGACGAVVEIPLRTGPFVGTAAPGVVCNGSACPEGEECSLEVTSRCRPPSETGRRLRCDDAGDCGGATCCIGERGPYLVSSCAERCDPESASRACASDEDCDDAEHCCEAIARNGHTVSHVGVCTSHVCVGE